MEDLEEDPEVDPADYLDDDKDEDEASKEEDDDKEEKEHLAPADSSDVPIHEPVPSAEETEPLEIDESAP
nr:hypothetical protein [Tanacetum cinerariifolium]